MGLYLCVFDDEEEIDGVDVGAYEDFAIFREAVVAAVEKGRAGSVCPTLIFHEDSDGEWSPKQSQRLLQELVDIETVFRSLPPVELSSSWKLDVAKVFGIRPTSLYDCFFDIDGEPLIERLTDLARLSVDRNFPILFQ